MHPLTSRCAVCMTWYHAGFAPSVMNFWFALNYKVFSVDFCTFVQVTGMTTCVLTYWGIGEEGGIFWGVLYNNFMCAIQIQWARQPTWKKTITTSLLYTWALHTTCYYWDRSTLLWGSKLDDLSCNVGEKWRKSVPKVWEYHCPNGQ